MSGALVASAVSAASAGGTGPYPDDTLIFSQSTPGAWSFPVPSGVAYVTVKGWAPGGAGSSTSSGKTIVPGPGGGGGGEWITHTAISGQTLSGVIGTPGSPTGPTAGTATTLAASSALSLAACTANPGGNGVYGTGPGAAGTASGGSVSNTSGHAGGLTNTWDGGGSPPGLVDNTAQSTPATPPGGGSPGGAVLYSGANGRVEVYARTS